MKKLLNNVHPFGIVCSIEMEKHPKQSRFLLGILDEPITDRNGHSVSWYTNKLGGSPNFIHTTINYPRCGLCGHDLALVIQIYAPLEGSPFHRTLYVFGCVNRICWTKPESWAVYRSQILDDEDTDPSELRDASDTAGNQWLDSANVWGSDEDDDPGAEEDEDDQEMATYDDNVTSRRHSNDDWWGGGGGSSEPRRHRRSPSSSPAKRGIRDAAGATSHHPSGTTADAQLCNANNRGRALDEQGNARDIFDHDRHLVEETSRLRLDLEDDVGDVGGGKRKQKSGTVPAEGAVGMSPDTVATADCEPADEGTITLDTPEEPTAECLQAIFGSPGGSGRLLTPDVRPVLDPWFLLVTEEPAAGDAWRQCVMSEHERDLLSTYQRQEGLNINQLYSRSEQTERSSSGEVYEKTAPRDGDQTFYKMRRGLSACPQQLLRYSRDPEACPIPISTSRPEDMDPGRCPYCGGGRSFELQIMPTAIGFLKCKPHNEPAIEFGTIIVYTCQNSCWREGDGYREERIVVQADPDDSAYAAIRNRLMSMTNQ